VDSTDLNRVESTLPFSNEITELFMKRLSFSVVAILLMSALIACTPVEEEPAQVVSIVVDGRELTYSASVPVTVAEFLRDAEIETGPMDRVSPPEFTQITDGMRITVVRVTEEVDCEQQELPYQSRSVPNEGLAPGEELLGQAGQNGTEEVCYRVFVEDGIRRNPVEISRITISEPRDEIIFIGPTGQLDPVTITGTLAYISNRNAWVMDGVSTNKRPLTTTGDLDQRVFSLSSNGRNLIYTRDNPANDRDNFLNELWLVGDVPAGSEPVQLVPEDVLSAEWVSGRLNTISYSTGETRPTALGWQAFNDLWLMQVDLNSGNALNIEEILEPSTGGLYGWWGTVYRWSPEGDMLAWARADSMGIVDLDTAEFTPLLTYPLFNPRADWSWRANISWSADKNLLLTTVHGPPIGNEPPEFSPAFNVAVTSVTGDFQAEIFTNTGIWTAPVYSPVFTRPGSEFPSGYIAFLQARDIANSINPQAEYDLIVADRDGSNARQVFPKPGQPGLTAPQDIAWSPDGRQVALIYQGNLWIIDVETEIAQQLTLDGGASKPVWSS
jgi:hypothetical protein